MIGTVPAKFEGRGRRVYPGFLQLCAFMSMNAERHSKSFIDLFHHRVAGDIEKADAIRDFYKEYFAIMDMSADFYLETVDQVFQRYLLPLGKMQHKGEPIDLSAIRKTFLLTVEGEKDDICAVGQTLAAQDLCSGLKPYMKTHHLQAGVGHYGVFNGRRWETQIYPVLRNHIQSAGSPWRAIAYREPWCSRRPSSDGAMATKRSRRSKARPYDPWIASLRSQ